MPKGIANPQHIGYAFAFGSGGDTGPTRMNPLVLRYSLTRADGALLARNRDRGPLLGIAEALWPGYVVEQGDGVTLTVGGAAVGRLTDDAAVVAATLVVAATEVTATPSCVEVALESGAA